ncbi:MAG: response regulator transcription factor [Ktedonobacteraceae bacterium]
MKLLLIDRDRDLVEMLSSWLKTRGYSVQRAYTVEQVKTMWREQQPDLVLMDTERTDVDMLQLCQELRFDHDALVMVLTAGKDVQDEVHCLDAGADDYLRKPFFPSQLIARLHALSRRVRPTLKAGSTSYVTVGALCIDALHSQVTIDGRTIHLTTIESKMLHLLALNANNVCTADQIVTSVWGYGDTGGTELIKTHIRHLRQKIEADPSQPDYIRTVPGVGYTLIRPTPEKQEALIKVHPLHKAIS